MDSIDSINSFECPICFNTIDHDNICKTECNHKYCTECLTKWLLDKKNLTCPTCRKNIKSYQRGMIIYQLLVINNHREVLMINPTNNPNMILVNKYWYNILKVISSLSGISSVYYMYLALG